MQKLTDEEDYRDNFYKNFNKNNTNNNLLGKKTTRGKKNKKKKKIFKQKIQIIK